MNNSRVIENYNINSSLSNLPIENHSSHDGDNENSSDEFEKDVKIENEKVLKKSASDAALNGNNQKNGNDTINQLSKSLGDANINCVTSEDDEPFSDALLPPEAKHIDSMDQSKNVFVSAAMSIDYPNCPPSSKYIRGDNVVSCWAMRPIPGDVNSCVFEWLLCIDLKGSLPKYVLNTVRSKDYSFNYHFLYIFRS